MAFEFQNDKDAKALGKLVAEGFGVGLSENSYQAITAMENVYVELESLTKNAAKNAENLAKKQQKRKLDNLKNSLELEIICEQEYYEKLKNFRDENLRYGTESWYKCTEEIAEYNKRVLDEAEEQQRKLAEKLIDLRDDLAERLKIDEPWIKNSKVTFKGLGKNGTDLVYNQSELKDFDEEIQKLELYRKRIEELKAIGNVPERLFSDIAEMDVDEGLAAVNRILGANDEEREKFLKGYADYESSVERVAGDLLGILKAEELRDAGALTDGGTSSPVGNVFIETLKNSFNDIPQSYLSLGERSGEVFGEGFLSKIPEIMETARNYFAATISEIADKMSSVVKYAAESSKGLTTNTYHTVYTFNSSRDTTTQQLNAARGADALIRLRGGNN